MVTPPPSEDEIASWDMMATLEYGREGLANYRDDPAELEMRRNILIRAPLADFTPILREVVMMSAEIEDIETVRMVIDWLEDAGDPAMGYYSHLAFKELGHPEWAEEMLQSGAAAGHLPAQRELSDRAARAKGFFSFFWFPYSRIRHGLKIMKIARKNIEDLRLK